GEGAVGVDAGDGDLRILAAVGGILVQADPDDEFLAVAGGGERALDQVEVVTGVDGETFHLGDVEAVGGPRVVDEFEDGANGAVGEDARLAEVPADVETLAVPDAGAAAAARRA